MQHEKYVTDKLLFYPGRNLSAEERRRIDEYDISISDLTIDHIVYSLSKQVENNFMTFYTVAEDLFGVEETLRLATEIGLRYGGRGYANLLKALNLGSDGSPRTMALYQDLVHAIRGPKHAAALFAEYDDKRCVVRRTACIYFNENYPTIAKYTSAFEQGCFAGYKAADRNLKYVEVKQCLCRGDGSCEQAWVYQD